MLQCGPVDLSRCYSDRIHGYIINGETFFENISKQERDIVLFSSYQRQNLINKEPYMDPLTSPCC